MSTEDMKTGEKSPPGDAKVGVVVIGRNERPRLDLCLASIPDGLPVVYADSDSSDGSPAYAASMGADVVALSPDRQMTAARGRNAGAKRLLERDPSIEFIQFVDGDCEFEPNWISEATRFLEDNPEVAVVCGRRREIRPESSLYNKLCHYEWNTPVGEADASGGDSLVRSKAFTSVGGFRDDQLAHEEPEMCSRMRAKGWKIWRIDEAMTRHDAAMFHLSQYYRRSKRAGSGICQVITRTGSPKDPAAVRIMARAVLWGLAIPLAIVILAFLDWRAALLLAAIYPLQWARHTARSYRQGFSLTESARIAGLSLLSKFAEIHGAADYLLHYRSAARKADLSY